MKESIKREPILLMLVSNGCEEENYCRAAYYDRHKELIDLIKFPSAYVYDSVILRNYQVLVEVVRQLDRLSLITIVTDDRATANNTGGLCRPVLDRGLYEYPLLKGIRSDLRRLCRNTHRFNGSFRLDEPIEFLQEWDPDIVYMH